MIRLIKLFTFILSLGIILLPVYAFASARTTGNLAGEGVAKINGWVISNVYYQFSDNQTLVKNVTFDLNGPADHVSVKLSSQSIEFTPCVNTGVYHWECNFGSGAKVVGMDEMRVVAEGN